MVNPGDMIITPAIRRWTVLGWPQDLGRLPVYWREVLRQDPTLSNVVMVLELVFGGYTGGAQVVRIATVPVRSVSSRTGLRHDALGMLVGEPMLEQVYDLASGTSAARSLALSMDPLLVDPARLIQRGIPLAGVAEIALERIDKEADHDHRWVLLRGDIAGGVRFGSVRSGPQQPDREILEIEIVDPRASVQTKLPPWIIDETRFDTVHESAQGARVPLVLNGYVHIPAARLTSTTPGTQTFVFAHGHGWTVDTTAGVRVNNVVVANVDATYGWTAIDAVDNLGAPYTAINFTNAATAWEDNDAVHVSTVHDIDDLDPVGVVLRVVQRHSALGVDGANHSLFAEAAAKYPLGVAPQVLINGGGGGSSTDALSWIESAFLESYPMISMVWEGGRYGPIYTDHRSVPRADWVVGASPLLDRFSLVEETPKEQIRNDFVLRYDYDPLLDIFRKVAVRGPTNSDVCAYSQQLFGPIEAEPIESPYITDDATAEWILNWLVEHQALPSYLVQYHALGGVALEYRRGDTVHLTDSELQFDQVPATIQALAYSRAQTEITLRVWARYIDLGGQAVSV